MEISKIEPKIGERKSSQDLKTYCLQKILNLTFLEFDIREFVRLNFARYQY